MNKIFYFYQDLKLDVTVIHDQYMDKFGAAPDLVVGLSRGGLIPAVHLSHMFNVPMVSLAWSTRDFAQRDYPSLAELIRKADKGTRILIVDDIFDSGETLTEISKCFNEEYVIGGALPVYATLMTNQNSSRHYKFVAGEVLLSGSYIRKEEDDWVVFPWENS